MEVNFIDDVPMVSVCLITYNHAPYIRECLEGILMQKTEFNFEVCVGEDESSDGTREICIELAKAYPDRIKLILRRQVDPGREVYLSQGVYNYIETTKECRGKYVALCDGDDVWTDPHKLQKQFDIMEADPSISLVHSSYDKFDELSGCRTRNVNQQKCSRYAKDIDRTTLIFDVIQRNYPIAASTAFLRTANALEIFKDSEELFRVCPMGDIITWCELVNYGVFHYQKESHVLYRILAESDSNSQSAEKKFTFVNGASNYGLLTGEKYNLPMDKLRRSKVKNCNRHALLSGHRTEIRRLYNDADFFFSLPERGLYLAGCMPVTRAIAKWIFQIRYAINFRLMNIPRLSWSR